jgi:RND family efflux transporter MFP subunit
MSLRTALIMSALLLGSLTAIAADRDAQKLDGTATSAIEVAATTQNAFLQGIARAKFDAQLRLPEQGTITAIHVAEGEWVKAGTPLLTIDDGAARAAIIIAKANAEAHAATDHAELAMKQARTIVTRTRIALHANAASEFELQSKENLLDQAIANYELQIEQQKQAQAQLILAEEQLKKRTLCAPFDGRVIQIHAGLGNTIDPTQVVAHVAKLNELEVEMHLPVTLFNTIAAGETRELRAAAPVNAMLKAKVVYVAPVVEPTSATFRVVLSIDNAAGALPAGFEVWYQHN